MPGPNFDNIQEILNERVMQATGILTITDEYLPVELTVGIIQVKEESDGQGGIDYNVKAGAYGTGAISTRPAEKGAPRDEKFSMFIQSDADESKREWYANGQEGMKTFGVALVRLTNGGLTGWVDEVNLGTKGAAARTAAAAAAVLEAQAVAEAAKKRAGDGAAEAGVQQAAADVARAEADVARAAADKAKAEAEADAEAKAAIQAKVDTAAKAARAKADEAKTAAGKAAEAADEAEKAANAAEAAATALRQANASPE